MRRLRLLAGLGLALLPLAACGGGDSGGGSVPSPPTGATTPTPTPTPTPNPFAAACGTPLPNPADMYGYRIKVQLEPSRNRKIINASPQVKNAQYCAAVGLGGEFCNTRLETDPQREACDHYLSGISATGRPGPNWYQVVNAQNVACSGEGLPNVGAACVLKDITQYMVDITSWGKFRACSASGSCGVCVIEEGDWGVIHNSPAGICKLDGE
ncbi:MAG: hypothetical protein NDJ94_02125 [Vicinamibacteria bacterium]|jgi:hypothetical protein|nr:hypothetical protein [Vicinamibacteria bacterium]